MDVKVSDDVFDALRSHFGTTQIGKLTSTIATYNMVARFLMALGVTPEAGEEWQVDDQAHGPLSHG